MGSRARRRRATLKPEIGEIWKWYDDDAKTHEHYGTGLVIGWRDAWEGITGPKGYVIFAFSEKGIMNIPIEMVQKLMRKVI